MRAEMKPCISITTSTLVMLAHILIFTSASTNSVCTRAPIITGYFRYPGQGILASLYNFTWQSSDCHSGSTTSVTQYQIEFVETCSITPVMTYSTGSNRTTAVISISSCELGKCYARVRAELNDGSFTEYSPCVLIKHQLLLHTRYIEQHYQRYCVPIQGTCDQEIAPDFFINGHVVLWPRSDSQYNATYAQTSSFCFANITEDTVLTEYCYLSHSTGCPLCLVYGAEVNFLSHVHIILMPTPRKTSVIDFTLSTAQYSSTVHVHKSSSVLDHYLDPVYKTVSSSITGVSSTSVPQSIPHSLDLLISVGVTAMILTVSIAVLIGLWCHKKQKSEFCCSLSNRKQENIYDEPSLPNIPHQELDIKKMSDSEDPIEMMGNLSYVSVSVVADSKLIACPAYVRPQDVN